MKKYKKEFADEFELVTESNLDGKIEYYISYTVFTDIAEPVSHKDKINYDLYQKIKQLNQLPVRFESGRNLFNYDIDLKKIDKMIGNIN